MTLEGIPLGLLDIGGWGVALTLAVLVVLGFINGKIYPSSTVDALLAEAKARLESEQELSQSWKDAWQTCQNGHTVEAQADRELLKSSVELSTRAIEGFQRAAAAAGGGEE